MLAAVSCPNVNRERCRKTGRGATTRECGLIGSIVSVFQEQSEVDLLATPLGKLDKDIRVDVSWCSAGMAVLAWVLGYASLPRSSLTVNQVIWSLRWASSESAKRLRFNSNQCGILMKLHIGRKPYPTLHWRLRQFSIESGLMDFASYMSSCNWGPWRLDELELCEGDLSDCACPNRPSSIGCLSKDSEYRPRTPSGFPLADRLGPSLISGYDGHIVAGDF